MVTENRSPNVPYILLWNALIIFVAKCDNNRMCLWLSMISGFIVKGCLSVKESRLMNCAPPRLLARHDASSWPAVDARSEKDPSRADFGPKAHFSETALAETAKKSARRTQPLLLFTRERFRLVKTTVFDPLPEGPRAHFWSPCVCRS